MAAQTVTVQCHDQSLTAAVIDGKPYVAMKPICENIGLDWRAQYNRFKRHPVLNSVVVMTTTTGADGKHYEMLMLPLDYLNGWLFGIDVSRVKPEIKDRLIDYQRECFKVLADYFLPKIPQAKAQKALPNGLTLDQQDALKALVKQRAQELPKDKQPGAIIKQWSAIKKKFGCSYKNIPPEKFVDAISLIGRLPLEGELLPRQDEAVTLSSADLAFLYAAWEETQHLVKDLEPVIDMFFLSTPMYNAHVHLKNLQTAVTHLRSRFNAPMNAAAEKHGLFNRKHWQPVEDAGKLKGNTITIHLSLDNPQYERYMVTSHGGGMVTVTPMA